MDENPKKEDNFDVRSGLDKLNRFFMSDWFSILVLVLALCACIYTIGIAKSYHVALNNHWIEQWNEKCVMGNYDKPNFTFNYKGEYPNENKDRYTNTDRTGSNNSQPVQS